MVFFIFVLLKIIPCYDFRKDNIFQIPGTTSKWTVGNSTFYEEYYFIQKYPRDEGKLKDVLTEFLEKRDILSVVSNETTRISINFMVADSHLPIWFEQNKSYFTMDDYIENYRHNRIALYTFDCNSSIEELNVYTENFRWI